MIRLKLTLATQPHDTCTCRRCKCPQHGYDRAATWHQDRADQQHLRVLPGRGPHMRTSASLRSYFIDARDRAPLATRMRRSCTSADSEQFGQTVAEVSLAVENRVNRGHQLIRRRLFGQIAGGACFEGTAVMIRRGVWPFRSVSQFENVL